MSRAHTDEERHRLIESGVYVKSKTRESVVRVVSMSRGLSCLCQEVSRVYVKRSLVSMSRATKSSFSF